MSKAALLILRNPNHKHPVYHLPSRDNHSRTALHHPLLLLLQISLQVHQTPQLLLTSYYGLLQEDTVLLALVPHSGATVDSCRADSHSTHRYRHNIAALLLFNPLPTILYRHSVQNKILTHF